VINPEYPEKGLRTSATGVRALRELGVEEPERNFIIVSHGVFLATLMKRTAFTQSELNAFMEAFEKTDVPKEEMWDPMPFLKGILDIRYQEGRRLLYKPGDFHLDNQFSKYFKSLSEGNEKQFIEDYPWNMKPCTDNRPFFFVAERWDNIFRDWSRFKKFPPLGFLFQIMQILWFGILTIVLVLLPLVFFHRKGLRTKGSKACILYFTCLGLGFMMVEIGFMQKFTLFLGHPTYSVSVILFSLLCFSGLGSLTSGFLRMGLRKIILFSVLGLVGISVLYACILDPIFRHFLAVPLGTRILISVALVAPLAFFMGMPFPTGLRIVEQQALAFVPWAWGINGSASVIAIFLASMIAVFSGFTAVVACAVLIYLLGMFVMVTSHEET
jgi:hypothetical protein